MKASDKIIALRISGFACLLICAAAILYVGFQFGPRDALTGSALAALTAAVVAVMIMLFIYLVLDDIKSEENAMAYVAKKFENVRLHINAAYTYTDRRSFMEPKPGQRLVAVDVSWRGPSGGVAFNEINMFDPETEDLSKLEQNETRRAEVAFLEPATGRPVEHLSYRIPSELRFLLVYAASSEMK
ncbi:MAG: hypothetical protein EG826_18290, partial [Deltaproteobacteria bacterium]|nr:hypothetical protein [Deltaproteobacteria bacterium]